MAEVGFIDPRDPRFVKTVDALESVLCDGPFMRRYEAPDDFGKPETAFNVCSFWRIDALARIGRTAQAREIFEAMLARSNHVGLLSEDLHVASGELWGNFPQTYSMVGVINGAVRLSNALGQRGLGGAPRCRRNSPGRPPSPFIQGDRGSAHRIGSLSQHGRRWKRRVLHSPPCKVRSTVRPPPTRRDAGSGPASPSRSPSLPSQPQ